MIATRAAAIALALPAAAVPIAPVGTTDVTVDPGVLGILTGAGISPAPIAPATASGFTFSFGITGGDTDPLVINHSGGILLFDSMGNSLSAANFVIDATDATVSADVSGTAFGASTVFAPILDLANVAASSAITADLLFNSTFNGALGSTFFDGADPGVTGALFGSATTSPVPAPIPLPATGLILIAAMGGLVAFRKRKAAA